MNKQQFFESLNWVEGPPPAKVGKGGWRDEDKLPEDSPPMAIETKIYGLEILGHLNLRFGVCDHCELLGRLDILRYAYLYDPPGRLLMHGEGN